MQILDFPAVKRTVSIRVLSWVYVLPFLLERRSRVNSVVVIGQSWYCFLWVNGTLKLDGGGDGFSMSLTEHGPSWSLEVKPFDQRNCPSDNIIA